MSASFLHRESVDSLMCIPCVSAITEQNVERAGDKVDHGHSQMQQVCNHTFLTFQRSHTSIGMIVCVYR